MSQQKIITTVPDKPINGASLTKESVAGRKTQFINSTTTAFVSFTLGAGQYQWITSNVQLWPDTIDTVARNENNLIGWESALCFPYVDIYVDTLDDNHYIGAATLSVGQQYVIFISLNRITPTIYSGSVRNTYSSQIDVLNNDSTPHTVYFYITYKYLISGDQNI